MRDEVCELFCLRRMYRGFIEDDNVFAKINTQFRILLEKSLAKLSRLPDEIALVAVELLAFSGIVPDDNEANLAGFADVIERFVIDNRVFYRIITRGILLGDFPDRLGKPAFFPPRGFKPKGALGFELTSKRSKSRKVRRGHVVNYSKLAVLCRRLSV